MTKDEMKDAVVEAMLEILWSDPVEDRLCDLTRDTVGGYLMNDEQYHGRNIPVTICEYMQNIESLLERIADALGA